MTAQHQLEQAQRPAGYTFVPLLPERWNGPSYERLHSRLNPRAPVRVACARPPLQGLAFLSATGQVSAVLDDWWRASVPADSVPVLIMLDEPELETWVPGLHAVFVIGVDNDADLARYASHPNVAAVPVADGPAELTEYVMRLYGGAGLACFLPDDRPVAGAGSPATAPAPAGGPPPDGRQPAPSWPVVAEEPRWSPAPDPFHALVAARPVVQPPAGPVPAAGGWAEDRWGRAARQRPARSSGGIVEPSPRVATVVRRRSVPHPGLRGMVSRATAGLFGGGRRSSVPAELTQLAMAHTEGKIVGVISRAGGVGKTAVAAALGIIYGEAVQDSGWCAAVLDQNTGNPDQWGRMDLGPGVRTVSQIMADIDAGREWTIPAWNGTPALAVYPESPNAIGKYTPAQIQRFADRLRQLHTISVVDLPNRMPDPGSSEGAISAGWVMVADLLAIPTTDDPTRLEGVVQLLDAPLIKGDARNGYRTIPVIVAYVSSPLRAIRQSQDVNAYLDRIRERAADVIEIPKDERATLAVIKGQPITEVDPRLREAYVRLALSVARTLADR